jgi:CheY-like chemotaxis protein
MFDNDDPTRSHDCDACALLGVRILLVEDDLESRLIVAQLLESYGAEVLATSAVAEALDAYDGFRPDVVVTDVSLRDRTGLDFVEELRQRGDPTPAVAMSGDDRRDEALERGCQAFLAKPVAARALAEAIRSVVFTERSA